MPKNLNKTHLKWLTVSLRVSSPHLNRDRMRRDLSAKKSQVHVRLICRSTSQKNPKWKEGAAEGLLVQSMSEDTHPAHSLLPSWAPE